MNTSRRMAYKRPASFRKQQDPKPHTAARTLPRGVVSLPDGCIAHTRPDPVDTCKRQVP